MQLEEATILIVEDEPVLCEIMGVWFERIAGRAFTAGDGAQALKIIAAARVDLLITDLRMPVMDGVTLLKTIRASGTKLPVILISGFSNTDARDAYGMGAEALLHKPMERQDLMDAVKRYLTPPEELWSKPPDKVPPSLLEMKFSSLRAALQQGKIAFGRGGLCVAVPQPVPEGPIGIHLNFEKEKQVLAGSGIVRWSAATDRQAGIELVYVAPDSREWLSKVIAQTAGVAFIPSSPESRQDLYAQTA